jgi:hypothetical protein
MRTPLKLSLAAACAVFLAAMLAMILHHNAVAPRPSLETTTRCMLEVLKSMPGVSEPKLGSDTGNVRSGGRNSPFLEYRAAEGASSDVPIRFYAIYVQGNLSDYWFIAARSGAGRLPDLHITEGVLQRWKTQCHADATVEFP